MRKVWPIVLAASIAVVSLPRYAFSLPCCSVPNRPAAVPCEAGPHCSCCREPAPTPEDKPRPAENPGEPGCGEWCCRGVFVPLGLVFLVLPTPELLPEAPVVASPLPVADGFPARIEHPPRVQLTC